MAKMTFVLGGARSGKSAFAEGLARKYNDVVYIATAEVKDEEMRDRIQIHRARRPFNWKTIEAPFHVDMVISNLNEKVGVVYLDCITLYITNMLLSDETGSCKGERSFALTKDDKNPPPLTPPARGGETKGVATSPSLDGRGQGEGEREILKQKQSQILEEINKLCKVCRESKSDVIMVSNEVGLGIVPDNALSRVFRDIAGSANQILADEADEVYFMVAGIAQRIK
ncbi:MAG: bifunctional adenosylcobinamide kinase/adenosylcobinamide-phosphate guanylyltransferase [Planctomycetes bacterium]|nr:bifunctional adenosylcobinamide kinase/adenosylcobinamide-phosphate guanylyltransferase [Planctomycetota bacterium]